MVIRETTWKIIIRIKKKVTSLTVKNSFIVLKTIEINTIKPEIIIELKPLKNKIKEAIRCKCKILDYFPKVTDKCCLLLILSGFEYIIVHIVAIVKCESEGFCRLTLNSKNNRRKCNYLFRWEGYGINGEKSFRICWECSRAHTRSSGTISWPKRLTY